MEAPIFTKRRVLASPRTLLAPLGATRGKLAICCLESKVLALTYINSDHSVLASTYSCGLCRQLPSAQTGLTAEFGMGSGVTPSIETPGQNDQA